MGDLRLPTLASSGWGVSEDFRPHLSQFQLELARVLSGMLIPRCALPFVGLTLQPLASSVSKLMNRCRMTSRSKCVHLCGIMRDFNNLLKELASQHWLRWVV